MNLLVQLHSLGQIGSNEEWTNRQASNVDVTRFHFVPQRVHVAHGGVLAHAVRQRATGGQMSGHRSECDEVARVALDHWLQKLVVDLKVQYPSHVA